MTSALLDCGKQANRQTINSGPVIALLFDMLLTFWLLVSQHYSWLNGYLKYCWQPKDDGVCGYHFCDSFVMSQIEFVVALL